MGWRDVVDADAVRRARTLDPDLDVDALGASLDARIASGAIRNPSAVFTVAAREARQRGTFRRPPDLDAAPGSLVDPDGDVPNV